MSTSAWLWAHGQTARLFVALVALLPPTLRRARRVRLAVWPLVLGLCFLPLANLDLTAWIYAFSGQFSVTSLALLSAAIASRIYDDRRAFGPDRSALLFAAAGAALVLYPNALGLGLFDLYAAGYGGALLPASVGALAVAAWLGKRRGAAMVAVTALWAWLLGFGESDNLWDYLLDAWLAIAAIGYGAIRLGQLATIATSKPAPEPADRPNERN